jgi:hypothetical protein
MIYFGYGSNMLTRRLRARVPSADPIGTGQLPGYRLHFHKRSRDGSGKCNIVPETEETAGVHGVLFDLSRDDVDALDEAEQRGRGYERQTVQIRGSSSPVDAFAYVAQPAYVDDALLPYDWYRALVLAGAREHDLPPAYISRLEAVRSYPDPNQDRRRRYQALLDDAGFPHLRP